MWRICALIAYLAQIRHTQQLSCISALVRSYKEVPVREKFGKGFNCWWLLQHKFNYKPLSTKVTISRQGTYNIHTSYRNPGNAMKNTSNDINYD